MHIMQNQHLVGELLITSSNSLSTQLDTYNSLLHPSAAVVYNNVLVTRCEVSHHLFDIDTCKCCMFKLNDDTFTIRNL